MATLAGATSARAAAQADYDPASNAWNGLAAWLSLAAEAGITVETPSAVDARTLSSSDALVLVHPRQTLPRADLVSFLRAGGRLVVADDFGTGRELLAAFEIGRHAPRATPDAPRLRGNRNLRIAETRGTHPLTRGVTALLTNHPQVLHHAALAPVATLSDGDGALVLVGAVGAGRLVAIGDASLFINNMLEFSGNRTFALNLLRYVSRGGRVIVATGMTPVTGAFDLASDRGTLAAVRAEIERLARVELPPTALRGLTGAFATIVFVSALSSLPRRASWRRTTRIPTPLLPVDGADAASFTAPTPGSVA